MEHPYRTRIEQISIPENLPQVRRDRIAKLLEAAEETERNKTWFLKELRKNPLELFVGENYRVVLSNREELELFVERLSEEAKRLTNPKERMWGHMNLLSGRKS